MSKTPKKSSVKPSRRISPVRLGYFFQRMREATSLTAFVSAVMLCGVLGASFVSGNYVVSVLNGNKLKDVWAILFLQMEQVGVQLSTKMRSHLTTDIGGGATAQSGVEVLKDPQIVYRIDQGIAMLIAGASKTPVKIEEMGLNLKATARLQVTNWGGISYVARLIDVPAGARLPKGVPEAGRYVLMWQVPIKQWLGHHLRNTRYTKVYSATREGRLLYSSTVDVTQENFQDRAVVQYFIRNQFSQMQTELIGDDKEVVYGFCYEVPFTNIVLFGEIPKKVALAPVKKAATQFTVVITIVTIMTLLIIQLPLSYIRRPMKNLIKLTQKLGSGDFSVTTPATGFGEIHVLAGSFSTMARSLEQRDRSIRDLMGEREMRARLQKEMEIAKGIQDSLLPGKPIDDLSGLSLSAKYVPADEVAGDWYHYHFWEETGESVLVIADVSGHGAGSSIFTAITAELFEDTIENCGGYFPMEKFAATLNRRIFKFGKGAWHCTLAILRFSKDHDEVEFLNAGHPPIIIKTPQAEEAKMHRKPGNPVGLSDDYEVSTHKLKIPKGSFGIMYSDGLIEAKGGANQRAFGTKKLIQILSKEKSPSISGLIDNTMNQWRKHSGKNKQADDICIVGFKRVS